jgi:hypothetical protein
MPFQYVPPVNSYARIATDLPYPLFDDDSYATSFFLSEFVNPEKTRSAKEVALELRIFLEKSTEKQPSATSSVVTSYNLKDQITQANQQILFYEKDVTHFHFSTSGWMTKVEADKLVAGLVTPRPPSAVLVVKNQPTAHFGGFVEAEVKNCLSPFGKYTYVTFKAKHTL